MRRVLPPALLHALRLLLLLAACGRGPVVASHLWSDPAELKHLYTTSLKSRFYLQIHPDGRVDGTPDQTVHSALIIQNPSKGKLNIVGAKTGLNLCMDSSGKLFGSRDLSDDCDFTHKLLRNQQNSYVSPKHKFLVSLGSDKGPYVPQTRPPSFSQFLLVHNEIDISEFKETRRP